MRIAGQSRFTDLASLVSSYFSPTLWRAIRRPTTSPPGHGLALQHRYQTDVPQLAADFAVPPKSADAEILRPLRRRAKMV
jgi:hypothetical protein